MAKRSSVNGRNWKDWLQIRPSTIPAAGRGMFARRDISANTILGEYHGRRVETLRDVYALKDDRFVFTMTLPDRRPSWVDGNVRSNYLRFVNGAKTAAQLKRVNVEAYQYGGALWVRAARSIRAGEELLLDYGEEYWETYSSADGIKHRNDQLLDRIEGEIENSTDARIRAALRGMTWLLRQMSSSSAYYSFFAGYLWMFYEFRLSKCNALIVDISTRLLELELDGAQFRLEKMFKSNIDDKWRFISLIPILFEVEADIHVYAKFYRSHFPRSLKYFDVSFNDSMANNDFEGMVEVLMDYCFLEMARRSSRHSRLFRLPESRFSKYWRAIKQYDIRALEASVTNEVQQSDLDYQVTHLVMCRYGYGSRILAPASKFDTQIFDYLVRHEDRILADTEDLDLVAEFAYCYLILKKRKPWVRNAISTILATQRADGSWGTEEEMRADIYNRCHPTWTAVSALCYSLAMHD